MILIRGKARKSVYCEMLFKSTHKALMIIYGSEKPPHLMNLDGCIIYPRSQDTIGDVLKLETELNELMALILNSRECDYYKNIFIYANFDPLEIVSLEKISQKLSDFYTFVFTIQDIAVPNGQIIIEELR
ncbi:hypothetical protein ACFQZE_06940 [Paenibacillus sp. GCM10027627]|uniref:hypothetical protein n=1 Tax=unclassified Paenibacillus TaxID=185978 RepID=UPI00363C2445